MLAARAVPTVSTAPRPQARLYATKTDVAGARAQQRAPLTAEQLKTSRSQMFAEAVAYKVYSQTLGVDTPWDRLLKIGDKLKGADNKARWKAAIESLRENRAEIADIHAAIKSGTPLPANRFGAEELNAIIASKLTPEDINDAIKGAIFGRQKGKAGNPKLGQLGQGAKEVVQKFLAGEVEAGAEKYAEQLKADAPAADTSAAWAKAFADSLCAADGVDEHVLRQLFNAIEAIRTQSFAPELFEDPARQAAEKVAEREAYWQTGDKKGNVQPYSDAAFTDTELGFLIHIAKSKSDFDTAHQIFQRNLKSAAPSTLIANEFLEFAFNRDKFDEVFKALDQLKAAGLPLSIEAYSSALRAAAAKVDVPKLTALYGELKAAGLKANSRVYATLIYAFGRAKQLDKALNVLKEIEADGQQADGLVYHALTLAEFKNGKADAWDRYKKVMAEKNITPHPLSKVFTETEQLDAMVPKVAKKPRTAAQKKAKKSSTGSTVLSARDAARLMETIEEKTFQRKQQMFLQEAGSNYTPLRPVYQPVGGAVTQRVHINRLLLSAHRFPHHHRVSPIGKLLIEGFFLEGAKKVPKAKKGETPAKPEQKAFPEGDLESVQKAIDTFTDKLNKAQLAGEAIAQIPSVLSAVADARGLLVNPGTRAEVLKVLNARKGKNPQLQAVIDYVSNVEATPQPAKGGNTKVFASLINSIASQTPKAAVEHDAPATATAAGADLWTQVLKRVAQTDKEKARAYAKLLNAWFGDEKRNYTVDPKSLTVSAK